MDREQYSQLKDVISQRKQEYDGNYLVQSQVRLVKIIEKKMLTIGVGAIADIEQEFGHLWGMDEAVLTDRHKRWKEVWDALRNRILNRTNDQIRGINNEFKQYTVKWNRHHIQLKKPEDGNVSS